MTNRRNNVGEAPANLTIDRQSLKDEMDAFDRMPPEARTAINYAWFEYVPTQVFGFLCRNPGVDVIRNTVNRDQIAARELGSVYMEIRDELEDEARENLTHGVSYVDRRGERRPKRR